MRRRRLSASGAPANTGAQARAQAPETARSGLGCARGPDGGSRHSPAPAHAHSDMDSSHAHAQLDDAVDVDFVAELAVAIDMACGDVARPPSAGDARGRTIGASQPFAPAKATLTHPPVATLAPSY